MPNCGQQPYAQGFKSVTEVGRNRDKIVHRFIQLNNNESVLLEADMFFEKMSNMPATLTKMPLGIWGDHVSTPVAAKPRLQLDLI